MKRIIILAAVFLAACTPGNIDISVPAAPALQARTLEIVAACSQESKAGPDENLINSLSVWMFDNYSSYMAGEEAICYSYGTGRSLTMEYRTGEEFVVVITNIPRSDEAFDIRGSFITLDEMSDNMVMSGGGGISDGVDFGTEVIYVSRIISKVSISKITNMMEDGAYAGMPVTVGSIYIINGVGRIPVRPGSGDYVPSVNDFFNCSCMYSPSVGPYPDFGQMDMQSLAAAELNVQIPYGQSITPSDVLYTGPNRVTSGIETSLEALMSSTSWAPRRSRLVVECSVAGSTCYYSIRLPSLSGNSWYKIRELIIKSFGSYSPDTDIHYAQVVVESTVVGWNGESISEII